MNKDELILAIEAGKFGINELVRRGSIEYCKKMSSGVVVIDYIKAVELLNKLQEDVRNGVD